MKRFALACAVILAVSACGPRRPDPVTAFQGRLTDWAREILSDSPELASAAGVSEAAAGGRYGNRLDDRSAVAVDARRSAAVRRAAELRGLNRAGFDAEEALTYSILESQFGAAADASDFDYGDFSPLAGIKPYVLNQLDSAFLQLPSFLEERHPVTNTAQAEAYLTRLRAAADAIDAETERARADAGRGVRPPTFIIDATVSLLDGVIGTPVMNQVYITSFRTKLDAIAAATPEAQRAEAQQRNNVLLARAERIVRDNIIPAHQRAAAFLRAERPGSTEDAGVSRLPRGAEFYAAALRLETTTELTPAQIHRIGLDRVAALETQLDIALRRVGQTQGTVGERLAAMTADPRYRYADTDEGRAELMADVQARVARVMERAPQWFGQLPRAPLEVRRVPVFAQDAQSGAYYNAPSLDGSQPGIYYVNLRDLGEMTKIDLPTQDFHEAAPGHHFQVALAQEQTEIPLLRRLITFNAYGEGWGLYAEELADELGFHEGDPVGRIGYLRWQLWRAVRLVVDTGIHAQGWSRQQAIDYMLRTLGDAPGVIISEVDRYIVWPGQACGYEIGRREIMRLREEARNELGPDFDLRGFHDAVLLHGETPLPVLEQVVREWVPEQRRLAERERRRR